ncbi:hypothetical protein L873DRAFT_115612 [Choiromyces venosus 120613-1]|uniref:Uncharacterized protein n=1 Tax=Choiromyces venosus 120613-1 TaxID=1336337 RepID=A0A3N4J3S0_9PEZI|nr:hypothetical protein L873DRAFT_115612 [Choiromyces venosus 120613-1]
MFLSLSYVTGSLHFTYIAWRGTLALARHDMAGPGLFLLLFRVLGLFLSLEGGFPWFFGFYWVSCGECTLDLMVDYFIFGLWLDCMVFSVVFFFKVVGLIIGLFFFF